MNLEEKYKRQERYLSTIKPELLKFISDCEPKNPRERDLLDYLESLIGESFSLPNLQLMLDMIDEMVGWQASGNRIVKDLFLKIQQY